MSSAKRLGLPVPVQVRADARGRPLTVDGRRVEAVRESWLVEDRWWTDAPVRRRYWEVVTGDGRCLVLFRELDAPRPRAGEALRGAGWFCQR
jgi:hypothetical protein